eukprot:TRINITY_DN7138_c0_g1_i1.p1 TRINITY_DN7138_c0_g1~~TRINITY_DN7138_c0_g1_i1.p1  ORF type:complete len:671 (-),score=180.02 TRINITY_DN7138_c0_g1_i1:53-1849(-)
MNTDIHHAKGLAKTDFAKPRSDTIADIVAAHLQSADEILRRKDNELRQADQRLAAADFERQQLRAQIAAHQTELDELKGTVLRAIPSQGSRSFPSDQLPGSQQVISQLDSHLQSEQQQALERENHLRALEGRVQQLKQQAAAEELQAAHVQRGNAASLEQLQRIRQGVVAPQTGRAMMSSQPAEIPLERAYIEPHSIVADVLQTQRQREQQLERQLRQEDARLSALISELAPLEKSHEGLLQQIEGLRDQVAELDRTQDQRAHEVASASQVAATKAEAVKSAQRRRDACEAELQALRREIQAQQVAAREALVAADAVQAQADRKAQEIARVQEKARLAQEEAGTRLLVLSAVLEVLVAARNSLAAHDAEIDSLTDRLARVEAERRSVEENLHRVNDSDWGGASVDPSASFYSTPDGSTVSYSNLSFSRRSRAGTQPGAVAGSASRVNAAHRRPRDADEEQLQQMFEAARASLNQLGAKVYESFAELKTKEDLDSLYSQQLLVTGAEMILRDKKINLLVEKVEAAERSLKSMQDILLDLRGEYRGTTSPALVQLTEARKQRELEALAGYAKVPPLGAFEPPPKPQSQRANARLGQAKRA